MHPDVVLGFDGGATRTRVVALDRTDPARVALAHGVGSNVDLVKVDALAETLASARDEALRRVGLSAGPVGVAVLGLAGVTTDADRTYVLKAASRADLAVKPVVRNDGQIAVAGAHLGNPGLVLIAGTGSACFGRDESGADFRIGGWGHVIGDEGSATWIGQAGLRAAVRGFDGRGPDTALGSDALEHLEIDESDAILHALYRGGQARARSAAFAPFVARRAHEGDAQAIAVLEEAAAALTELVVAALDAGRYSTAPPMSAVGGVIESVRGLRHEISSDLAARGADVRWTAPALPPVLGAVMMALLHSGTVRSEAIDILGHVRDVLASQLAPTREVNPS